MSRNGNLEYIDALRGLAILGVLCVHFAGFGMPIFGLEYLPFNLEALFFEGKYGVALFFVVSAFTLMRSMEFRILTENLAIRKYFLRRFFRIAPAFYLVILLVFFIRGTGVTGYTNPDQPELTLINLFAHMTFLNGFSPYYINDFIGVEWSVATEFSFYMLLPFIMIVLISRLHTGIKFLITGGGFFISLYLYWYIYNGLLFTIFKDLDFTIGSAWGYFFIGSQLHVFIVGVFTWLLMTKVNMSEYVSKNIGIICLLFLCFVGVLFAYIHYNNANNAVLQFYALTFWGIMSGLLIISLDIVRPRLRWLEFFGRISFSLYLVHYVIGSIVAGPTDWWIACMEIIGPELSFWAYFLLTVVLSSYIAFLMHKYIELPGINYGKDVINKRYA